MSSSNKLVHVPLMLMIACCLLLLLSCKVHSQQIVSSKVRCHAGPFKITFESTLPVSFGTSVKANDGYNTSTTFKSIVSHSKSENSHSFRVDKSSEDGDYFIFNSPQKFSITYSISVDFTSLTASSTQITIPAYGYERLFTSNLKYTSSNSLKLTNTGSSGRYSVKIGYAFSKSETPTYRSLTLQSSTSSSTLPITVPSQYYSSSNIPLYIFINCDSSKECNLKLEVNDIQTTTTTETNEDDATETEGNAQQLPPAAADSNKNSIFFEDMNSFPFGFMIGSAILGLVIVCLCVSCLLACYMRRQKKKKAVVVSCVDASTETSFITVLGNHNNNNTTASNQPTLAFVPSHCFNSSSSTVHTQVELQPQGLDVSPQPQLYPSVCYGQALPQQPLVQETAFEKSELPPPPYPSSMNHDVDSQPVVMYQTMHSNQTPKPTFDADPNFKV